MVSTVSSKSQEYLEWAEEKSPRDNNKLSHCASIVLTNSHMSDVPGPARHEITSEKWPGSLGKLKTQAANDRTNTQPAINYHTP